MNPAAAIIEQAPQDRLALLSIDYAGERQEWSFGQVAALSASLAGRLSKMGVKRGDTVMMVLGSRPEWVLAMLATWRIGAIALPCHASLRTHDLSLRISAAKPRLILCEDSTREAVADAQPGCEIAVLPAEHLNPEAPTELFIHSPAPVAELRPDDAALVIFTSGTTSEPTGIVHGVRWIAGQNIQANGWFGAPEGSLAWCTAAPGWSKSARNVFLSPWLCGAAALIHDARFDPMERLEILQRESVGALCQAPTEYRVMAAKCEIPELPRMKSLVGAGEALDPQVIATFQERTGLTIRDGFGQTETGHLTGVGPGEVAPPGSMGKPLPGMNMWVEDGELVVDPMTVPTFFLKTLGGTEAQMDKPWHTGDRVREEDGFLFFEGRDDDIIASAGYRIGPFEVESALGSHPAVAESAAVAHPDLERGSVVRSVVVLKDGFAPSEALARELQEHVKSVTAPYKYPRVVEFVESLPKTATGKVRRSVLREDGRSV